MKPPPHQLLSAEECSRGIKQVSITALSFTAMLPRRSIFLSSMHSNSLSFLLPPPTLANWRLRLPISVHPLSCTARTPLRRSRLLEVSRFRFRHLLQAPVFQRWTLPKCIALRFHF